MSFQPIFAKKSKIMMIKGSKQQQLTFDKGMTNVPSDLLCADNTLSLADGMIFRNGEHHVIQKPVESDMELGGTLIYVHRVGENTKKYIVEKWDSEHQNYSLYNSDAEIDGTEHTNPIEPSAATAIGNTLIVIIDGVVYKMLYKNGNYGTPTEALPYPEYQCYLANVSGHNSIWAKNKGDWSSFVSGLTIRTDKQEGYNNFVVGLYSKNKRELAKKGYFVNPFFVRFAVELFDGSYTFISQPILMFPSFKLNSFGRVQKLGEQIASNIVELQTNGAELWVIQKTDDTGYTDIVKGIAVFVSLPVDVYDTNEDQPLTNLTVTGTQLADGILGGTSTETASYYWSEGTLSGDLDTNFYVKVLSEKTKQAIENGLKDISNYYKICTLEKKAYEEFVSTIPYMDGNFLDNLTTKEFLKYDDYYSRCPVRADSLYVYNSRLNMVGVRRGFFEGFDFFMPLDDTTSHTYDFYVTIKSPYLTNDVVVHHQKSTTKQMQGIYFYYPDPRASHVTIFRDNTCVCDADLTEHPALNGAYYFRGLEYTEETVAAPATPTVTSNPEESLGNYVLASEVSNPFVFKASGYYKVGDGYVIGMSAQTQALSQGQFGQFPLIVFTTDGIWALSLSNTGEFLSAHPMSREVCTNSRSITQTDSAIFFVSKRGLNQIVGSQVTCVSRQLEGFANFMLSTPAGYSFATFFQDCFMVYDYRDGLLWIFNTDSSLAFTNLIYSIRDATFAVAAFTDIIDRDIIQRAIPDYPDTLLQGCPPVLQAGDGYRIYSLNDRQNPPEDPSEDYRAQLISRPLKLENALALKTIIQAVHVKALHSGASMTWRVEASNNAVTWVQLSSLTGIPWKYYRFTYTFSHLSATDSFAGTVLITQERRTYKLR